MINYIVTCLKELWVEDIHDKFIADPFVYYKLDKNKEINKYNIIDVSKHARQSVDDLKNDSDFVKNKYDRYIPVLANRLNQIHDLEYSEEFWEKALSVGFERYITYLYELYRNCEINFDKAKHTCKVIALRSIKIPIDFDNQRDLFQHSDLGQEQIFSLYINHFYPSIYVNIDLSSHGEIGSKKRRNFGFLNKLLYVNKGKIKRELVKLLYRNKKHKVGIMGSFFSADDLSNLIIQSDGSIYPFEHRISIKDCVSNVWSEKRDFLAGFNSNFDRFDRFFFYSMKYFFPKIFVENFTETIDYFKSLHVKNKSLRYMTSEAWPSSTITSIGIAFLKTKGVKHVYNEHNYYSHPLVASELDRSMPLVDIFVSLGWYDSKYKNMIRGGSLFGFKVTKANVPSYDICFITDPKMPRRPQYSASYGTSCENVLKSYDFTKNFFKNLNDDVLRRMHFRGYPKLSMDGWLAYDDSYMLQPYYNKMQTINSDKETGLESISKSRLVIVDYISTPHMQSIVSNIPTVFFHNKETYFLKEEYGSYYDPLIEAGICHTNSKSAAKFIEKIVNDPYKWWNSTHTKELKEKFLKENFGEGVALSDYLIKVSKIEN
jgi:putative transferase (TIGR04331 family)